MVTTGDLRQLFCLLLPREQVLSALESTATEVAIYYACLVTKSDDSRVIASFQNTLIERPSSLS
jgi:hypothetical protein